MNREDSLKHTKIGEIQAIPRQQAMLAEWRWQGGANNVLNNSPIQKTKKAAGASSLTNDIHPSSCTLCFFVFLNKKPAGLEKGCPCPMDLAVGPQNRPCRLQLVDRGGETSLQPFDAVSGIMGNAACESCARQ